MLSKSCKVNLLKSLSQLADVRGTLLASTSFRSYTISSAVKYQGINGKPNWHFSSFVLNAQTQARVERRPSNLSD
jgi:hypothetical protein